MQQLNFKSNVAKIFFIVKRLKNLKFLYTNILQLKLWLEDNYFNKILIIILLNFDL